MALTKLTSDMDVISALSDAPVADGSLTTAQFKAKFDQAANAIKTFINATLTAELDALFTNIVAATANKLTNARYIGITDADASHTGTAASFDGSASVSIKLPATIKADIIGDVTGSAYEAVKLATARNVGNASFDGSGNITLAQIGAMAAAGGTFSGDVTHSGKATFNGQIVLSANDYGTTLPAAGTAGRLFFKKV